MIHCYFKLFNSIKSEHEAEEFAKLEIESLFGKVEPISNFVDHFVREPLSKMIDAHFTHSNGAKIRLVDIFTHELPYGRICGYYGTTDGIIEISKLVKRLGYTKEIIIITQTDEPENTLKKLFPDYVLNINAQFINNNGYTIYRFITHQYFLEKSEYISKVSRDRKEVDANVNILLNHLTSNIYRIPATETMKIGKRLEDYFCIREELSLYLTHYMHPYKGKFHPKMVRALLNHIMPGDSGTVLDNFAGSGTLLTEAQFLGLDSVGVEINPLSVLMTNVKCDSLKIDLNELAQEIGKFLNVTNDIFAQYNALMSGLGTLSEEVNLSVLREKKSKIPNHIQRCFKNNNGTIDKILLAYELVKKIENEKIRDFILLALSGCISDASRRISADFAEILQTRLKDLFLRLYLFHTLNKTLKIRLGNANCYIGDTRDMQKNLRRSLHDKTTMIPDNSIDGIINSPPYSTALDYIKNDEPQLCILEFANPIENLENSMIGNPREGKRYEGLLSQIEEKHTSFTQLPPLAQKIVYELLHGNRKDAALRCFKYFSDMYMATKEMYRVLKPRAKCTIIIGNNHFLVHGRCVEIPNDEIVCELGKIVGFERDRVIKRELEKSSTGMIRYESVIILKKP